MKSIKNQVSILFLLAAVSLIFTGYKNESDDGGSGPGSGPSSGGNQTQSMKLDLSTSKGMVVSDGSSTTSAGMAAIHKMNAAYLGF